MSSRSAPVRCATAAPRRLALPTLAPKKGVSNQQTAGVSTPREPPVKHSHHTQKIPKNGNRLIWLQRGPRPEIGVPEKGPHWYQGDMPVSGAVRGGNQKSAPQRSAHFTGTFLTFPASKQPFGYLTAFSLSQAARRAFWAHEFEQNRFALETRRPLLHFGMTAPQLAHVRLADGSMPILAITARISFFSQ